MAAPKIFANVQGSDTIKIGIVGCGGRGTGAVGNAVASTKGVQLIAMGDLFEDRLKGSQNTLKGAIKDAYQVGNRSFVGFDNYKHVMAEDIDYVIIATPPGVRAPILEEAVANNKHVFMEKPVATDARGIRRTIAASKESEAKGLSIVAGTQRRHDRGYREIIKRIHDGQIGDIVSMRTWWNGSELWNHGRKDGWSDVEWQMRNWLYFTWIGGDHIVEQHVHQLDIANWVMGGHPDKAYGMGGRQKRTDPAYGHIFDHFSIQYSWDDRNVVHHSMCRQQNGTASRVSEHVDGSKGSSNCASWIRGEDAWTYPSKRENPYVLEHRDLINAIRNNKPVNEGVQVAESTMAAIMGRMAAYTGQEITWDQALNSEEVLVQDDLGFTDRPVDPIAIPGITKFK